MRCPICSVPLGSRTHEGVPVAACPNHHGLFLGSDQLGAVVALRDEDRTPLEEDRALEAGGRIDLATISEEPRSCPNCGDEMRKLNFAYESGVVVDTCDQGHGVWLDAGELQRVEAWVEGSERLAAAERGQWHARLNVIEMESDNRLADDDAALHARGFRRLHGGISRWWLRRDDAPR